MRSRGWLHLLLAQPWCFMGPELSCRQDKHSATLCKEILKQYSHRKSVMLSFVMLGLSLDEWTSLGFGYWIYEIFIFFLPLNAGFFHFFNNMPYTWKQEILAEWLVCYFWTLSQSILYLKNIHIIFCFKAIRSYLSVNQNKNVRNARFLFSGLKLPIPLPREYYYIFCLTSFLFYHLKL